MQARSAECRRGVRSAGSGRHYAGGVDLVGFWGLVERSALENADPYARAEWIARALTGLSDEDLVDFQEHLDALSQRAGGDLVWQAAALIRNGCGDDSFSRFRAWLIGLGRDTFERVVADPDHLADRPEVQRLAGRVDRDWADEEWPEWEEFEFVAVHEYERRFGPSASIPRAAALPPTAEEPYRELSRLAARFPENGPF